MTGSASGHWTRARNCDRIHEKLITVLGVVLYYWHGSGFEKSGFVIGVVMSLTVALFMVLAIAFWKDSYVDS
ncbi:MAG: hypothetical protein V5A55_04625 [Halovenus sp.]